MKHILSFPSNTSNLRLVEPFLAEIVRGVNMDTTRYHNTIIALTEAVNNAIVHGNKRDESKPVTLTVIVEDETLTILLEDHGMGFDPNALPDPLAPENLLRDGGRGVFLMRSLMDMAEFSQVEGGTLVTLRTRLRDNT